MQTLRPITLLRPVSLLSKLTATPTLRPQSRFSSTTAATDELPPRWLSTLRARIGKCIMFGLDPSQTHAAGLILKETALDWRELVAGSEGFLTGEGRGLFRQAVVWGEMDSMGHVNNVVYNRYAESARVNWTRNFKALDREHEREWEELMSPKGVGLILRSIKTEYKFPMKWPDRVTVLHKLRSKPEAGADHFILDVLILSEAQRRAAARCVEDIVVYDYRSAKKTALPPFMMERFSETFALQEQAKQTNSARVRALLERVRALETSSWDRADAVEDVGSAGVL